MLLADAEVVAGTGILGIVAAVSSELEEEEEEDRIDMSLCCSVLWDCCDNNAGKMTCSRDNDTLTLGAVVVVVVVVVVVIRLVLRRLFCKRNPLSEMRAVQEKLGCKVGSGTALVSTPNDTK